MASLKFSVGTIKLQKDGEDTDIGIAQEIGINYTSAGQEFRGGDYDYPLDIQLGDKSCEVTVKTSKWDIDPSTIWDNALYSLVISAGKQGGGSTGTITNLKLISYNVVQRQNEYVLSDLVFRKVTDLT